MHQKALGAGPTAAFWTNASSAAQRTLHATAISGISAAQGYSKCPLCTGAAGAAVKGLPAPACSLTG